MTWEGVLPQLDAPLPRDQSERAKRWYAQFLGDAPCTTCSGTRLRAESAAVRVGGRTIVEVSALTVDEAREFFAGLELDGRRARRSPPRC